MDSSGDRGRGVSAFAAAYNTLDAQPIDDSGHTNSYLMMRLMAKASDGTVLASTAALAAVGYPAKGLYSSVIDQQEPVLCAACHSSASTPHDRPLGTTGY